MKEIVNKAEKHYWTSELLLNDVLIIHETSLAVLFVVVARMKNVDT